MENEILNTEEAVNAEAEKAVQEDKDDFEKVMAAILLIVYNMEHTKVTAKNIKNVKLEIHNQLGEYLLRSQRRFEGLLQSVGTNTHDRLQKLFQERFEAFDSYYDRWHVNKNDWYDNLSYSVARLEKQIIDALTANINYTATEDEPSVDTKPVQKAVEKGSATHERTSKSIVQDECHYVLASTLLLAMKANGYTHFRFKAVLDDRTSDICRGMNGRVFPISAWSVGSTVPPLHRNCRSVVVMCDKNGVVPVRK